MSESIEALHRANPRVSPGFAGLVEAATGTARARIATAAEPELASSPRVRLAGASAAAAALVVAAGIALFVTLGSPGSGPGTENATAAVAKAAALSAASAERSGTAAVRIVHDGVPWARTTIRWHGDDLSVSRDVPNRQRRAGAGLLVVDGTVYGIDPADGGWVAQGSPANIDPGSGTTPAEYLAAVREDVGGATLKRITGGMTGLDTNDLADGSTVYSGDLEAALIASETGVKGGRSIRVLPFGYVAHDGASDPTARLHAAVTVGPEGVVREIRLTWGTWSYTVAYSRLGTTPALVAPANARSLLEERMRGAKGSR